MPDSAKGDEPTIAVLQEALNLAHSGALQDVVVIGGLADNRIHRAYSAKDRVLIAGFLAFALTMITMPVVE